jgi:dTMP kinase
VKRGWFVVLEGIDSSGKRTQLDLLTTRLKKTGRPVEAIDFPRYRGNVFGELVGRYLNGDFGRLDEISPYLAVLPYMIDQYLGGQCIEEWKAQGKIVVANRYFTSNVHQIAKLPPGGEREKYRRWLWRAGWEEFGIFKPDLVVVLLVPPAVSEKLATKKGKRAYLQERLLDIAEIDRGHQAAAYEEYRRTARDEPDWVTIDCLNRRGELEPAEEIHGKIWALLLERGIIS